ncbi:MAG TPA: hypothetical protein VHG91_14955 [Longimicrobium sp.]|nr:hypothetical protein [Longimicrobium sp.]
MKKLSLHLDDLAVESFPVAPSDADAPKGTVAAHEAARTLPLESCFWSAFPTCGIYC